MSVSLWVFFSLFIVLMAYDGLALIFAGYKATVSARLYKFSCRFPIIAFLLGGFMGHLFWPNLGACEPTVETVDIRLLNAEPEPRNIYYDYFSQGPDGLCTEYDWGTVCSVGEKP